VALATAGVMIVATEDAPFSGNMLIPEKNQQHQ
jgi:hypothetical protein